MRNPHVDSRQLRLPAVARFVAPRINISRCWCWLSAAGVLSRRGGGIGNRTSKIKQPLSSWAAVH